MIDKLVKTIQASAIALILVFLMNTNIAHARGGCFGGNTPILTREGSIPISQLHQGDRIIGYNCTTDRVEDEQIGNIEIIQSPNYYLINGTLEVTKDHPFYVPTAKGIELVEVKNLKIGDRLLSSSNNRLAYRVITSIDRIEKPMTVYNLIAVTPAHNFYANGILVHNKGGGGGGGGGHGGGGGGGHGYTWTNWSKPPYRTDNVNVFYSFLFVLVVIIGSFIPVVLSREIYNFVRFYGKEFTDDSDLITFGLSINPNYTNCYSVRYSKDNEIWQKKIAMREVDELVYDRIISKSELVDRLTQLFVQYQADWTRKDFDAMIEYIEPEFYAKQALTFQNDFGNNFDIVYNPEILAAIPISYDRSSNRDIFKIQVDARMINFEISTEGYILSGEAYPRSFSEYWTIAVDDDKKCVLMDIDQI